MGGGRGEGVWLRGSPGHRPLRSPPPASPPPSFSAQIVQLVIAHTTRAREAESNAVPGKGRRSARRARVGVGVGCAVGPHLAGPGTGGERNAVTKRVVEASCGRTLHQSRFSCPRLARSSLPMKLRGHSINTKSRGVINIWNVPERMPTHRNAWICSGPTLLRPSTHAPKRVHPRAPPRIYDRTCHTPRQSQARRATASGKDRQNAECGAPRGWR